MRRHTAIIMTGLALATVAISAPAHACWDGRAASTEKVTLMMMDKTSYNEADAREAGRWLARIEALLPEGGRVETTGPYVSVCRNPASCEEGEYRQGYYGELFEMVAAKVGADQSVTRRARHLQVEPWTVQVFASSDSSRAYAVAQAVDTNGDHARGYYEAGGFPAINPTAHVVRGKDNAGHDLWRVSVGAYLDRAEAEQAARQLHARGFSVLVRAL